MIRVLRRRLAARDPEAGIGLVELIAASFISLLMLTLVGGMFIQITKLTGNGQATKDATGVAWSAMNELSAVVRQATQVPTSLTTTEGGVVAGSTPTMLVVDSLDRAAVVPGQAAIAPSRVVFSLDASGNLLEQRIPGVLTGGYYGFPGTGSSRTVGGPLVATRTGTDALFVYYSGTGSTLAQITPGVGGLTTAETARVTTVGINVVVANTVSSGSDPVVLTNLLTMPNVAIINGGN